MTLLLENELVPNQESVRYRVVDAVWRAAEPPLDWRNRSAFFAVPREYRVTLQQALEARTVGR